LQAIASVAAAVALTEGAFLLAHYGASTALANFNTSYGEMPAVLDACSHSLQVLRHFQGMESSTSLETVKKNRTALHKDTDDRCMREPWSTVMQILKFERAKSHKNSCLIVVLHPEALKEACDMLSIPGSKVLQLPGEQPGPGEPVRPEVCISCLHLCCTYSWSSVSFFASLINLASHGRASCSIFRCCTHSCLPSLSLSSVRAQESTIKCQLVLFYRFKSWPEKLALRQTCYS
jgi:hypothetical protein